MNKSNLKKYENRIQKNKRVLIDMFAKCIKCGKCCEVLHLSVNYSGLEKEYRKFPQDKDLKFILENLIEITREEALEINKYISQEENLHYFTCKQFDNEKRVCKAYGSFRPYMCEGYPHYDRYRGRNNTKWLKQRPTYNPNCGYWKRGD